MKERRASNVDWQNTRDIAIATEVRMDKLEPVVGRVVKEVAAIRWTIIWCTGFVCAFIVMQQNGMLKFPKDAMAMEIFP